MSTPCLITLYLITSPAPNAGAIRNKQPESVGLIIAALRERAEMLLALATHLRIETLVLGAWGCGGFQNDPAEVAAVFSDLLDPCRAPRWSMREVVFAVYDRSPSKSVHAAFESRFAAIKV
jgi:uncharacterized protein (TIGR02452 family)